MFKINGIDFEELLDRSQATPAPNAEVFEEIRASLQMISHLKGGFEIGGRDLITTLQKEMIRLKPENPHLN